ncbi:MAG: CoA transferase [Firmicutes bacterium]|nr:CoA transferase [Bacillota bacterium]
MTVPSSADERVPLSPTALAASPWLDPAFPLPLAGVRVLDLSRVLAGPFATQLLGDLGADVIRVEGPGGTDDTHAWKPPEVNGESVYYLGVNRNKRSLVLDLQSSSGQEALRRLLVGADVLVENFRLGTMERLGLGPHVLRRTHPRLIYARVLGFGSTGPYASLPGYDLVAQAMSGFMDVTGEPDRPGQKVGVAITDVLSGLYLATAVIAALFERNRTGRGRYLEVSLLECAIAGLANLSASAAMVHTRPTRVGNVHPTISPYETFPTLDQDIVLAVGNNRQFVRLCKDVLQRPDLAEDPRFATNADRVRSRALLHAYLAEEFRRRSAAYWVQACWRAGVPCGPVQDIASALADPHIRERGMIIQTFSSRFGSLNLVACPIWTDDGRLPVRLPPPSIGEHTASILSALHGGNDIS